MKAAIDPRGASRGWRGAACLRRHAWESGATVLIAAGVFMLMQPFSLTLYGYSFATVLAGTVTFVVVSKFPE
jgi:hypothetical protein